MTAPNTHFLSIFEFHSNGNIYVHALYTYNACFECIQVKEGPNQNNDFTSELILP